MTEMKQAQSESTKRPEGLIDVTVENGGSIFQFILHTDAAREWVEENVKPESWQWFGPALIVEARYANHLAAGMLADGLEVE